jgi:hypothetical protein
VPSARRLAVFSFGARKISRLSLTTANLGLPEGLHRLDGAVVVDTTREKVRCCFGGLFGRLVQFYGEHWL